jgi:signal peptidase I
MPASSRRKPHLAVLLSLLAPGLGHVYSGRIVPGLALLGGGMARGSLGSLGVVAAPAWALTLLGAVALVWVGRWGYAAADAWRVARKADTDFVLREYNRWYVYLILGLLVLSGAIARAIDVRENVVQAFVVPTESMSPTIRAREGVLVDKLAYRNGPVCRGDVVVFRNPSQPYQHYITRVVALGGDTVEIRQDELYVNGARLARAPQVTDLPLLRVPTGHCFVLGDQRQQSVDSREFGPVPLRDIVGRVRAIWRPRLAWIAGGGGGG